MKQMNRSTFLKTMGATLAGTALHSFPQPAGAQDRGKPNVVFIFCDDLGWADLPCHGYEPVKAHGGWTVRGDLRMPNVDRLAAGGTMFTQFYVPSAVCSPSRTGMMTGQFPSKLGIHDYLANHDLNEERGMPDYVDPSVPTLTRLLRSAGYATGHFGKWHLGSGDNPPAPEEYGIDSYNSCSQGEGGRPESSRRIADTTIDFIRNNRNNPFYVNVWLYDPHSPLKPTEEHLAAYSDMGPNWGDRLNAMQVWYSVLTELDRQVGRIIDTVDELGLGEDTIIVFSSDNGPESALMTFTSHYGGASSTNTGPFRGIKRSLYEGGIREPFIVRWNGTTPAGAVDDTTVLGGVDFLPTICALAGVDTGGLPNLDGEDLSAALRGTPTEKTKPLMWENRFPVYGHVYHKSPMLAIREGDWKLLMNPDRSRVELYNIATDPCELNNLADQFPTTADQMANTVLHWQKTLPPGPVHEDAGSNDYPWPAAQR